MLLCSVEAGKGTNGVWCRHYCPIDEVYAVSLATSITEVMAVHPRAEMTLDVARERRLPELCDSAQVVLASDVTRVSGRN